MPIKQGDVIKTFILVYSRHQYHHPC